jgi:hypothetical protein
MADTVDVVTTGREGKYLNTLERKTIFIKSEKIIYI